MDDKPLDELYLTWLYSQVGRVPKRRSPRTYLTLLRQLYNKKFVPIVPRDDNRAADGINLRYDFIDDERIEDVDPAWMDIECSMLEMLIGLSRIFSFEAEGEPRDWFWVLLKNMNLYEYNDIDGVPFHKVEEILDRIIWRRYQPNGRGGIFPLKYAKEDQREVELWYQMSAYLLEMGR